MPQFCVLSQFMRQVFTVKQNEFDKAREMETKLLRLPMDAGILFVGVSVIPDEAPGKVVYCFWIGCDRNFSESLMDSLVRHTFKDEILNGMKIQVHAHRGVGRAPTKLC